MEFYFTDRKFNFLGVASTDADAPLVFTNDEDVESILDAARSLEGIVLFNEEDSQRVANMAKLGNYVLYYDQNGKSVFSTIMDFEHDPLKGEHWISTEDAGMDMINGLVEAYQADKAMTFQQYFDLFTAETGFEIGVNEISNLSRTLKWESESQTILARMISVATQFDNSEIDFSFTINGTQVIKRYLNVYKKRGSNKGIVLNMDKDINNIVTSGNIYDLCTAVKATGGDIDGKEVNLIGYNYTDPTGRFVLDKKTGVLKDTESVKIWSRNLSNVNTAPIDGYTTRHKSYETTNQKTLCDNAVRELTRASQPNINYETDIAVLPDNVSIGDTVSLADEEERLFLQARVLKLSRSYSQEKYVATLGDYLIISDGISQSLLELQERLKREAVYVWIVYADDENGTGISQNPTGKKYIAIKQVQGAPNPSMDPSDYEGLWVQYVGGQGIQGPQGPDGKPRYTWIKYADDESGNGMSDSPEGKWFLGTATNKETQTPSNNPGDYKWQLVKGENGKSAKVYTAYSWSADGKDRFTIPYPNENTFSVATWDEDKYKEPGQDIEYIDIKGVPNTSYTIWTNIPELEVGVKNVFFMKDKEPPSSLTNGVGGARPTITIKTGSTGMYRVGVRKYAPSTSASERQIKIEAGETRTIYTPSPLDDFENAWPTFIGTYTTFDDVQSTNPEVYTWARMLGPQGEHGEDGAIGPQGPQGPDGPEGNGIKDTIIAYAASTSGTTAPTTGWQANPPTVAANSFLWTRVTLRYTNGTDVHSYSVGKMGANGSTGNGVKSSEVTYAASTSGTTAPTTGWQSSPPSVAANSFLWTRVLITYTDNSTTTSYSVGKMGAQGPQGPQGPQGNQGPQGPQGINGVAYAQPTQPSTTQEGAQWYKTVSTTDLTVLEVYTYKGGSWKKSLFAAGALKVEKLDALSANLGNITAGNIKGVSIEASQFISAFENVNVDGGPAGSPVGAKAKGTLTMKDGKFSSVGTIENTHTFESEFSPVYISSVARSVTDNKPDKLFNLNYQGLHLVDRANGYSGTLTAAALTKTPWIELTLRSGFSVAENNPPSYRVIHNLDGTRTIEFRGQFLRNSGPIAANTDVNPLNLPVGIRPETTVMAYGATNTGAGARAYCIPGGFFGTLNGTLAATYVDISAMGYTIG